jgi:hypothetical protein
MPKKLLLLFVVLLSLNGKAQSVGMDSTFYSYTDTANYFANFQNFQVAVRNTGNFVINDSALRVYLAVDSSTVGLSYAMLDSVDLNVVNFQPDSVQSATLTVDTIMPTAFRSGVNTVVIWPRSNAAFTSDTLFLYFFVDTSGIGFFEHYLKGGFVMHPNPADNELFIVPLSYPHSFQTIGIYDLNGRLVLEEDFQYRTDLSQIPTGFYFVRITRKDGIVITCRLLRK